MREHGRFWKDPYLLTDCARSAATVHNPGYIRLHSHGRRNTPVPVSLMTSATSKCSAQSSFKSVISIQECDITCANRGPWQDFVRNPHIAAADRVAGLGGRA